MDSPPLPVPVGSPPCTIKSYNTERKKKITLKEKKRNFKRVMDNRRNETENRRYFDDAMKLHIVIISSSRKLYKIPTCLRRVLVIHLQLRITDNNVT